MEILLIGWGGGQEENVDIFLLTHSKINNKLCKLPFP